MLFLLTSAAYGVEHQQRTMHFFERDLKELSSHAYDMVQDKNGYYWFATASGLKRYDGEEIVSIHSEKGSFLTDAVTHQLIAVGDELWVSSLAGLAKLDLNSYELTVFQHNKDDAASLSHNNVRWVYSDKNQTVWVATARGVNRFDPASATFEKFYLPQKLSENGLGEAVISMAYDGYNRLWAASAHQGLLLLDVNNGVFEPAAEVLKGKLGARDYKFFKDIESHQVKAVLLSESGSMLVAIDNQLFEFSQDLELLNLTTLGVNDKAFNVRRMVEHQGEIWLTGVDGGLAKIDVDRKQIKYHFNEVSNKFSIRARVIRMAYFDQQGNLCLIYLNANPQFWNPLREQALEINIVNNRRGLDAQEILRVDPKFLWLRTIKSILKVDRENSSVEVVVDGGAIESAVFDDNNNIFISTIQGTYSYNIASKKKSLISNSMYTELIYSKSRGLWALYGKTIVKMGVEGKPSDIYTVKDAGSSILSGFSVDNSGRIWAVSKNKIHYLNVDSKEFVTIPFENNVVRNGSWSMFYDGVLWVGGRGLLRAMINIVNDVVSVSNVETVTMFGSEVINKPKLSPSGEFWMGVAGGDVIFNYDPQRNVLRFSDRNIGFPTARQTRVLGFDGEFLLLGEKGKILKYEHIPELPVVRSDAPKISYSSVLDDSRKRRFDFGAVEGLILNHRDYAVDVHFTNLLQFPDRLQGFQYRLKNWDDHWTDTDANSVSYAYLSPGEYWFEVRNATTPEKINSIRIESQPAAWLTSWAYFLYFSVAALLISVIFYLFWDRYRTKLLVGDQLRVYAQGFENIAEGFCVVSKDLTLLSFNKAFVALFGAHTEGKVFNLRDLKPTNKAQDGTRKFWLRLLAEGSLSDRLWMAGAAGEDFPVEVKASVVEQRERSDDLYMLVFTDISRRVEQEQDLEHRATYDSLTDLPNRYLIYEKISQSISLKKREKEGKFALLFMDVDGFKAVNDKLGHDVGDALLVELSKRLTSSLRQHDIVGRLGGDEFIVLVGEFSQSQDLGSICQKLLASVGQPFFIEGHEVNVSLSIGVSVYPDSGDDMSSLVKNADSAMYTVKDQGGRDYAFYSPSLSQQIRLESKFKTEVERSLSQGEFILYYQPKFKLEGLQLCGVEALLRWHNPEKGLMLPGSFIEPVARAGLMAEVDKFVLLQVCEQLRHWKVCGLEMIPVAVNLSPNWFLQMRFNEQIIAMLNDYPLEREFLEFEITEDMLMQEPDVTAEKLQALRDIGCRVSVDNFGRGYSSFSCLSRLPIDIIKVDQGLILNIENDVGQQNIVSSIIDLARNLNKDLVVEGVENPAANDYVVSLGATFGQGFFYAMPCRADDLALTRATEVIHLV